ncbi:MAG: recombinase RecT, partial [Peptostreptococcaceae bacterium]
VINRACKLYVNTTNDSGLFAESFNKSEELTTEEITTINDNQVETEIEENANKTTIDMNEVVVETEYNEVIEEDVPVMEVLEGEVPF